MRRGIAEEILMLELFAKLMLFDFTSAGNKRASHHMASRNCVQVWRTCSAASSAHVRQVHHDQPCARGSGAGFRDFCERSIGVAAWAAPKAPANHYVRHEPAPPCLSCPALPGLDPSFIVRSCRHPRSPTTAANITDRLVV